MSVRGAAPSVRLFFCVCVLWCLLSAAGGVAQEPIGTPQPAEGSERFIRILRDAAYDPISMDTAVVSLRPRDGSSDITVDLYSAVHVGEGDYYQELNRRFRGYDAVLYELVAPPGAKVQERERDGASPVSAIQTTMKSMLELEFQLDAIDYEAPNFVHADMSPQQFAESMKSRGESLVQLFMKAMGGALAHEMSAEPAPPDLRSVMLLFFPSARAIGLRRIMAKEFGQMDKVLDVVNGEEGSTLVQVRNQVALNVLRREMKAGKKKLAIFYGGAHMRDFEERLMRDFELAAFEREWIVAWRLRGRKAP